MGWDNHYLDAGEDERPDETPEMKSEREKREKEISEECRKLYKEKEAIKASEITNDPDSLIKQRDHFIGKFEYYLDKYDEANLKILALETKIKNARDIVLSIAGDLAYGIDHTKKQMRDMAADAYEILNRNFPSPSAKPDEEKL